MTDLAALAHEVSTPIKVGWVFWLAWGIVQIDWYRRARILVPAWQPAPRPRPERQRAEPSRSHSKAVSTAVLAASGTATAVLNAQPPSHDSTATTQQSTLAGQLADARVPPDVAIAATEEQP